MGAVVGLVMDAFADALRWRRPVSSPVRPGCSSREPTPGAEVAERCTLRCRRPSPPCNYRDGSSYFRVGRTPYRWRADRTNHSPVERRRPCSCSPWGRGSCSTPRCSADRAPGAGPHRCNRRRRAPRRRSKMLAVCDVASCRGLAQVMAPGSFGTQSCGIFPDILRTRTIEAARAIRKPGQMLEIAPVCRVKSMLTSMYGC